jgi:hypothetical protein
MQSSLFAAGTWKGNPRSPVCGCKNKFMLKIDLDCECFAHTGSMVVYQGNVKFAALGSGGAAKWLKSKRHRVSTGPCTGAGGFTR